MKLYSVALIEAPQQYILVPPAVSSHSASEPALSNVLPLITVNYTEVRRNMLGALHQSLYACTLRMLARFSQYIGQRHQLYAGAVGN